MCCLRYNSPTLNLQIFPAQYIEFCKKIEYYMNCEVTECNMFTDEQTEMVKKHYRTVPEELGFPFAMCDDILIALQHYHSFEEFKETWNRRKKRVNYMNLRFVFLVDESYRKEANQFAGMMTQKDALFTWNWALEGGYPIYSAENVHFMDYETVAKKYYMQSFNIVKWLNQV